MDLSTYAGKLPPPDTLINVPALISAYYTGIPDPAVPEQRIAFGTSGHRGSSLNNSFNEFHILAITQAICLFRKKQKINGPLFLGMDTHALSWPAQATALEVLAANGVETIIASGNEYTPTPAVSQAILNYNRGRKTGLSDGIIITPSHNPPPDGGFKYNPPNGGPADTGITGWIESAANGFLMDSTAGAGHKTTAKLSSKIKRVPLERALKAPTTHRHDYLRSFTGELASVINMELIRSSGIPMGVNPLGGAGVHYWGHIAEEYRLHLHVINTTVDPTFRFMTLDHDGQIRMDPSSPYAMKSLIDRKDEYRISFACDTDHDRHGIVTPGDGLLPPNHYLCVAIDYLFTHRPGWGKNAAVGKTIVSSSLIDRVTARLKRKLSEVPVGFKWFVDGLTDGSLGFVGEESAGASFLKIDGSVWTTDKDGFAPALLSAEITARTGKDPGEIYRQLTKDLGEPSYKRIDTPAGAAQRKLLGALTPDKIKQKDLGGEKIQNIVTKAPGNDAPIGGIKVSTENGWFAARPSGTEDIYKIYGESFLGADHLQSILTEAQSIVDTAIGVKKADGAK
jgi:phosphoglucomutase